MLYDYFTFFVIVLTVKGLMSVSRSQGDLQLSKYVSEDEGRRSKVTCFEIVLYSFDRLCSMYSTAQKLCMSNMHIHVLIAHNLFIIMLSSHFIQLRDIPLQDIPLQA